MEAFDEGVPELFLCPITSSILMQRFERIFYGELKRIKIKGNGTYIFDKCFFYT